MDGSQCSLVMAVAVIFVEDVSPFGDGFGSLPQMTCQTSPAELGSQIAPLGSDLDIFLSKETLKLRKLNYNCLL